MKCDQLKTMFEMNYIRGVIILGDIELGIIEQVLKCGLPVITAGFCYYDRFTDSVLEENFSAGYQAIQQFLARNYKSIGFVGNPSQCVSYYERYLGYIGAMEKFKLERRPEWEITNCNLKSESVNEVLVGALANMEMKPDAFFCSSDKIALRMVKVLNKIGLRIPQDIGIIGFDDSDLARASHPRLSTFNPNNQMQADCIIRILLSRINHSIDQPTRIIVPIEWVEGETVRKIQA